MKLYYKDTRDPNGYAIPDAIFTRFDSPSLTGFRLVLPLPRWRRVDQKKDRNATLWDPYQAHRFEEGWYLPCWQTLTWKGEEHQKMFVWKPWRVWRYGPRC